MGGIIHTLYMWDMPVAEGTPCLSLSFPQTG